jgi:hypothetical protein
MEGLFRSGPNPDQRGAINRPAANPKITYIYLKKLRLEVGRGPWENECNALSTRIYSAVRLICGEK